MSANNSFYAKRHKQKHDQLRRELAKQEKRRKELALTSHYFWAVCSLPSFKTKVVVKQVER